MEDTLQDGVRDGIGLISEFVPKLLLFLLILVLALINLMLVRRIGSLGGDR